MTTDRATSPSTVADKFIVRLPDGMREQVAISAARNKRSMNAEMVALLEVALSKFGELHSLRDELSMTRARLDHMAQMQAVLHTEVERYRAEAQRTKSELDESKRWLSDDLRVRVAESAITNGRTIEAEIAFRLKGSFQSPSLSQEQRSLISLLATLAEAGLYPRTAEPDDEAMRSWALVRDLAEGIRADPNFDAGRHLNGFVDAAIRLTAARSQTTPDASEQVRSRLLENLLAWADEGVAPAKDPEAKAPPPRKVFRRSKPPK